MPTVGTKERRRRMNESWKEKFKRKLQESKENPKVARSIRLLGICAIAAVAFTIVSALKIPGIFGLVLRLLCFATLLATLFLSFK